METPDQLEYYASIPAPERQNDLRPTPDNPPWHSWEAIGVWVASILLIVLVPAIFFLPYLVSTGMSLSNSDDLVEFAKSDPTAIVVQILAIIPAHLLTVGLCWLVVTRRNRFAFLEMLGWKSGGFAWWHYIVVLIGFAVIAGVVSSLIPEQENDLIRILKSSRSAVYVVAFVATVTAPFVEEVVYRGVLYPAFQRTMGVPAAVALVTLLFALVHVPQYWPSHSTILLLTLLSLILTTIRVKTGNLLPCVVFHTLFNGLQSIFLIIEPSLSNLESTKQISFVTRFLN